MASDNGAALRLRGVSKRFGGVAAVSEVDLDVMVGTRHGIIGPNGAGKTTLFNLISGELSITSGSIELFGEDITHMAPPRRVALGLGRTYQITRTFSTLSVWENLALGVYGLSRSKFSMLRPWTADRGVAKKVAELGERVGLADRLDQEVANLSHGEVRQLEVGLALALEPTLLLLDEPAAGLSPAERIGMRDLLHTLPEDLTLLMIEHDMDIVRESVERITVLHFGEVVADGTVREIQNDETVREIYLGKRT